MSDPIRIAVVGPGIFWNKAHKPALTDRDDVEIVGFCAGSDRRRREVAAEFPGRPFFTDLDSFLAGVPCDVVLVLTPLTLNGRTAIRALDAGRHVVVEKPLAPSLPTAARVVDTARARGLKLLVGVQTVYRPVWRQLRRCLEEGRIGRPVAFEMVFHFRLDAANPDGYGKTWRADGGFPLGVLFDGGAHNIATLSALFGPCRKVYATGLSLRDGFGEYDHVLMHMQFDHGVHGTFSHAGYLGSRRNYFYIRGTEGVAEIQGDQIVLIRDAGEEERIDCSAENPHAVMWDHFMAYLRGAAEPMYTAEAARDDVATLEAIAESCHSGKPVTPRIT